MDSEIDIFPTEGKVDKIYDTENTVFSDEIEKMDRKSYSDLEWAAATNSIMSLLENIKQGETIFHSVDGVCERICNGFYDRHHQSHPSKCKRKICYKTAVLYALRNNCRAYRTVYKLLRELQEADPEFRKPCNCCDRSDEEEKPHVCSVNNIMDSFSALKCECKEKNEYCKGYKETYLNFVNVHEFLSSELIPITSYLETVNPEPDNSKPNNIVLEQLDGCIHEDLRSNTLINCKNIPEEEADAERVKQIATSFLLVVHWYQINCEIVVKLFNQQAYELYQHSLNRVDSEESLDQVITYLVRDTDPYVDINYVNSFQKHSMLSMTVEKYDYPKIVRKFLEKGAHVNGLYHNMLFTAISNRFYSSAALLIEHADANTLNKELGGQLILNMLVTDSDLNINSKIDLIREGLKHGMDPNIRNGMNQDIMAVTMQVNNGSRIIPLFFEYGTTISRIPLETLDLAIRLGDYRIVDILLKNGSNVNDFNDKCEYPIFTHIKNFIGENDESAIDMLKTILKYDPDLTVQDRDGFTPLYLACKYDMINTVKYLMEYGADPFDKDNCGNTCLMAAVRHNSKHVVSLLVNLTRNDVNLINVGDSRDVTPVMAAVYSRNQLYFVTELLKSSKIDCKLFDQKGWSCLTHLVQHSMSDVDRVSIVRKLLPYSDVCGTNGLEKRPPIIQAVERNQFKTVHTMFNYLVQSGRITVTGSDVINFSMNSSIAISTDEPINYFPAILMYLKQLNFISNKNKRILGTMQQIDPPKQSSNVKKVDTVNTVNMEYSSDSEDEVVFSDKIPAPISSDSDINFQITTLSPPKRKEPNSCVTIILIIMNLIIRKNEMSV